MTLCKEKITIKVNNQTLAVKNYIIRVKILYWSSYCQKTKDYEK